MKFSEAPIQRDQISLIPTTLGDLIPEDHAIRLLDELLDQLDWTEFNKAFRNEKRGRPPLAPQILASVWIYGFFRRIKSSRQLEYQLKTNIEFMWLAHGHRIDHTTLAIFRKNNKQALQKLQQSLIKLVKDMRLIKIAELYVDGTRIQANASRARTMTAAKASKLLNMVQKEIDQYLEQTELNDQADDLFDEGCSGDQLPEHLATLNQRKEQIAEILATCTQADATRKKQGINPAKNPFQLPLTDSDSRILPNKEGGYGPNYTPIIGVEGELGLIVSDTVINSVNEQDYLISAVDDVEQTYGVTVQTVGADSAYSIGSNITELEFERGKDFLSPHRNGDVLVDNPAIRDDVTVPVADEELDKLPLNPSTKKFSAEAFVYDPERDVYHCPQGRQLTPRYQETRTLGNGQKVQTTRYFSESCDDCPLLSHCRQGNGHRRPRSVSRDEHETNRAAHRAKMSTEQAKERYRKRLSPGERPSGQIKQHFGVRRFQTRGNESVSSEFSLLTIAHNALRVINTLGSRAKLRALLNVASQET